MKAFNVPSIVGSELEYVQQAVVSGMWSGEGLFGQKASRYLEAVLGGQSHVILTPSCTAALEMAAVLLDVSSGDEVIMPSFTFVSTANAFALRGARPVFADVDPKSLNIRVDEISRLITRRTKAVVVVHYAGWPCEMDAIKDLLDNKGIPLIEDAAHALGARFAGQPTGTFGSLGTFSFHETKNVTCGEGGALVVNDQELIERAHWIRDKGTNRRQFQRGDAAFYTWVSLGSSYVMSEVLAAFLFGQLEQLEKVNSRRLQIVSRYSSGLRRLHDSGRLWFPLPADFSPKAQPNGHLFYILLPSHDEREKLRCYLVDNDVGAVFHYQPLHKSPFMITTWGHQEELPVTESIAARLLRLPMYYGLTDGDIDKIVELIEGYFSR
jgi:dTDP-4-amino-4,6-dideoxygalactose transaminase